MHNLFKVPHLSIPSILYAMPDYINEAKTINNIELTRKYQHQNNYTILSENKKICEERTQQFAFLKMICVIWDVHIFSIYNVILHDD